MKQTLSLPLLIALMMFPQIVETIYSPALTDIATAFNVSQSDAGQTLSLYFIAFAFGVVIWGYSCDWLGRKPTVLIALFLYGIACVAAIFATNFDLLLMCRMLMAFSAAIGSIGTQTIMRDRLSGETLRYVFSIMGIALAISPIVGMLLGALMVSFSGYHGVFILLILMAIVLLAWVVLILPETKPEHINKPPFFATLKVMLCDPFILKNACLIGFLNIALFAYYQLAPFMFDQLGLNHVLFGLSGILLGLGSFLGAFLNKRWIQKYAFSSEKLVTIASIILLISSALVLIFQSQWFFILPMVGVVMAYSIAIPNILAKALMNYGDKLGTAGAILGLMYYLIIGIGLMLVAYGQHLGLSLVILSILVFITQRIKV